MLTETQYELLTSAVDGVLPPAQEAALRTLVAESAEAKETFRQLIRNQRRIKAMVRRKAPADLAANVLARLPVSVTVPAAAFPARRAAGRFEPQLGWMPYFAAASLFFTITAGSFWANAVFGESPTASAQQKSLPRPVVDREGREAVTVAVALDRRPELLPEPRVPTRPNHNDIAELPTPVLEPAPTPRPRPFDVIGSGLMTEPKPHDPVHVRLPFLGSVSELDRTDVQTRLGQEVSRDSAFRLDLFAKDTTRATEMLVALGKAAGLNIHQDGWADDRLRRKPQTTWVLYTESLSADELGKLLSDLAVADRVPEKPAVFGSFHIFPATHAEQRDLRDVLGVDPGLWKRPGKGGAAVPTKSVTNGTVGEVIGTLTKGPKPGQQAIVLPLAPAAARVPASSAKVKAFLDQRGDRKAGAVPVLIVVKPLPG